MRKYIALLLSIIICIGFFGCSKGVSNTVTSTTVPNTSVIQTTAKAKDVTTSHSTTKKQTTAKEQTTTKAATKVTDKTKATKVTTTEKITKVQTNSKKPTVISTTKVSTTTTPKQTTTKGTVSCTVTVECTSVLNNMDKLKAGHSAYVPNDGYIINNYRLNIKNGSTVYDAVKAACTAKNIYLNAVNSSFGKYIVGFNYIDEKDCGNQSGWLYMVNGKYPSVSCDKYIVENRDKIVFEYTCK